MIENFNTSPLSDEEFQEYASGLNSCETVIDVLDNLKKRRQNVLNGGINCIPLPFDRFRSEIPGIEQGQYIVITANQKVTAL